MKIPTQKQSLTYATNGSYFENSMSQCQQRQNLTYATNGSYFENSMSQSQQRQNLTYATNGSNTLKTQCHRVNKDNI